MIASRILKAMLWSVWMPIKASDNPTSLRDGLVEQVTSQQDLVAGGSIAEVTANGHTNRLASFGQGQVTAAEALEGWVYLVDLFDISAAELGADATDAQVEAQMEVHLRPIVNVSQNFMYLSK